MPNLTELCIQMLEEDAAMSLEIFNKLTEISSRHDFLDRAALCTTAANLLRRVPDQPLESNSQEA